MKDKLLCPFCQQELERHWGMEEPALYCCDNPKCSRGGVATESAWQELIHIQELLDIESAEHSMCHTQMLKTTEKLERTRKALDIAVDEITKIRVAAESVGIGFFMTAAISASVKIKRALEQKDVK